MPWVRIDEEFPDHPKVVGAGPLGIAMQVAALCYCNRHLTDGFVPRSAARRLIDLDGLGVSPDDVISTLLSVGMWLRVDGGYQIHDYDHYQPTREQVLAERERNRAAGQKGGLARAAKRTAKRTASGVLSEPPSGGQADRLAKPLAESKPVPVPPSLPSSVVTHLAEVSGVAEMPPVDNPVDNNRREGKGRAPRTPRHPSDEFVINRARQIRASSGPDAATAYLRTVSERYGQMSRDDQLRRMEEIIAQDAAAEGGDP